MRKGKAESIHFSLKTKKGGLINITFTQVSLNGGRVQLCTND